MVNFNDGHNVKYTTIKAVKNSLEFSSYITETQQLILKVPPIKTYKFNNKKVIICSYSADDTLIVICTHGRTKGQLIFGVPPELLYDIKVSYEMIYVVSKVRYNKGLSKKVILKDKEVSVYFIKNNLFSKLGTKIVDLESPIKDTAINIVVTYRNKFPEYCKFKYVLL